MCFLQGFGLAVLKVMCVYTRAEQICKWVVDNESRVSRCRRLQLARRKTETSFVVLNQNWTYLCELSVKWRMDG